MREPVSVSENSYKYLFPFEKIPLHSRIIIYGAGTLGQDYLRQMQLTHYCEVVAVADKNYHKYPPMIVPVISPDKIHKFEFDYVVIALRMAAALNEVKRVLEGEGVADQKIVCILEREGIQGSLFREHMETADFDRSRLAFFQSPVSVAVLSTGGYGDMVIQKRFIVELLQFAPDCRIDFYNIKAIDFLRPLYSDCENVNQIIPDLGSRYRDNHKNYALALTIEACHFIRVDEWKREEFEREKGSEHQEFIGRIEKLKTETSAENVGISTPVHLTMIRRAYQGLHAYSGFNYNGAFHIADKKVSIPLEQEWEQAFQRLQLGKYMTVNFGNGDCMDGSRIAKSWSKDKFERFICLWKEKYPDVAVVQLGAEQSEKLRGAERHILGADFRLSVHILKNSILHVDIEGGLVHIATQLGTKCVVLFGPTVKEYYGYEQNINIQAGNCHNCWGLYSDVNRCARGMKEPECMDSITPEIVMGHIDAYMRSVRQEEEGYDG